jgi:ABC-type multidrug transport system ATPase subunit
VHGLRKRYRRGPEANRSIDLEVFPGEVVAVVGPNGAGKTTFLRQLTTELQPTSGSITVFGIDAVRDPHRAKALMGITPQEAGLFDTLTVTEHLELFGRLKGLRRTAARREVEQVIARIGLGGDQGRRVGSLSGGQRRRVLIGLALLGRPPLLVLDEPTTGLDPSSRLAVWQLLREAVSEGTTLLFSTHYMEEAERLSDRIAIIQAGRVIAYDTLPELVTRVRDPYRVTFRDPRVTRAGTQVHFFSTFAEAERMLRREGISEYSIGRASLEDVYFVLVGEPFPESGRLEVEP